MNTMEGEMLTELLDLDVDSQLGAAEKARLTQHLETDPSLRAEHRRLESLHALMREATLPVRPDFRARVMAQRPTAAWEPRPSRVPVWSLPLAMMVALGVAATLILGTGFSAANSAVVGTGLAIFDFLQMTALTGAGLLAASWRGFGLGLEELMTTSSLNLGVMAVFVLCLNLLFFSMLRRRSGNEPALETSSHRDAP